MNRKGQLGMTAAILLTAVAVIVALAIFSPGITNPVGLMTTMVTVNNQTVTAPSVVGSSGSSTGLLTGQAVHDVVITNQTSGTLVPTSNYTITNYVVSSTGELKTTLTVYNGTVGFQGKGINVTYTYEPYGYDTNSGNRSIIGLIILLSALAIFVVAITPIREALAELF